MKSGPLKKLVSAVAVLILLAIVTSPVTTIWLIKRQAAIIVDDSLRGLTTSSLASMNVSEGFLQTATAVSNGNPGKLPEILGRLEETTRRVDQEYQSHRETLRGPHEIREFDYLLETRADYRQTRAEVLRLLGAGEQAAARELFETRCEGKFGIYADALGAVLHRNATEARMHGARIIRLCYILLAIQVVLLGFFFVYGFFVPLTAILERLTRVPVDFRK